jgi:hypothetical protein
MVGEVIEELSREDCSDLGECVCNRWVFTDEPRRERLSWHDNLDWTELYDPEILEAWIVTFNVARA